jgi:hypothetical protein
MRVRDRAVSSVRAIRMNVYRSKALFAFWRQGNHVEKGEQAEPEADAGCGVDLFVVEEDRVEFAPGYVVESSVGMAVAWVGGESDVGLPEGAASAVDGGTGLRVFSLWMSWSVRAFIPGAERTIADLVVSAISWP